MKKLPAVVVVVSGAFFVGLVSSAHAHGTETSDKWQQFCETASPDSLGALNGRMRQLGEEGWELTGVTSSMTCYKRPWRKGADPLAAAVLAPVPSKVALVAPAKVAPPVAKPLVAKSAITPMPVAKPMEAETAATPDPEPAIAAAAAEVMAAPSVTQAPAAKPAQAQSEPTAAPSRSLLPESAEPSEPAHPRRALVPKS